MRQFIYCKPTAKGIHSFYLVNDGKEYFLFNQNYRKGVHKFFSCGVSINVAMDIARANRDHAIIRTMEKLHNYIKYIEKEYCIAVLARTIFKQSFKRYAA